MTKFRTGIYFFTICLLLAACSSANFAYNRAPGFISDEFEQAFDLNPDQTEQLDSKVRQFFTWHRKVELGRYQLLLKQAATDAENGISADEFLRIIAEVRGIWNRSMNKAIDEMGDLATTLSPQQISHFESYYRESLEDDDNYLERKPDRRQVIRATRSLERLEGWYGDFDNALEDRLFTRLQELPNAYEPWLEYRDAQITELVRIFASASDTQSMQTQLRYLLLDPQHPITQKFEPTRAAYWKAYGQMLEEINGWLTPEQQQNAVDRLERYVRLLSDIEPQG